MSDIVLHSFVGEPNDGENPYGSLILSGTTLYGTTILGGQHEQGTVFSISETGGPITILYSFGSVPNDGSKPYNPLILSQDGTTLYGTTYDGGQYSRGTVFSISKTGGAITILHSFQGQPGDGDSPRGGLIFSQDYSTLYGTTQYGGAANLGTVFSLSSTVPGPSTILHSFAGGASDGANPFCTLIFSQDYSTLYGTTKNGGATGLGTVFSVTTPIGATYSVLHYFAGGLSDGGSPFCPLTLSPNGTTLYGTTQVGGTGTGEGTGTGAVGAGTVFSVSSTVANGPSTILHSFAGGPSDGAQPISNLIFSPDNTTLFGATQYGGNSNNGMVFSISTTGTDYTILYYFGGQAKGDGRSPSALIFSQDYLKFYGSTYQGGTKNYGTIFSINAPPFTPKPPPTPPISNICFPAGTPIKTDQGYVAIDQIDTSYHTIGYKRILDITQTVTLDRYLVRFPKNCLGPNWPSAETIMTKEHKVLYQGELVPAYKFLNVSGEIKRVKYSGETLYNVLQDSHSTMNVNNLICETLHPDNLIAKIYKNRFSDNYNDRVIYIMNDAIERKKYYEYKTIVDRIHTAL